MPGRLDWRRPIYFVVDPEVHQRNLKTFATELAEEYTDKLKLAFPGGVLQVAPTAQEPEV